jgi:hypothetical protein
MTLQQHTVVRVDGETLARIEALRKRLSAAWRDATMSDVLRALIYAGLNAMEKEHTAEAKKNRHKPASQRVSRST